MVKNNENPLVLRIVNRIREIEALQQRLSIELETLQQLRNSEVHEQEPARVDPPKNGDHAERPVGPTGTILKILADVDGPLSSETLIQLAADKLQTSRQNISTTMWELKRQGRIRRTPKGKYSLVKGREESLYNSQKDQQHGCR